MGSLPIYEQICQLTSKLVFYLYFLDKKIKEVQFLEE